MRTNIKVIEDVSRDRARSDTIVISLNEERFQSEYMNQRKISNIPILPGVKPRLKYVAVVCEGKKDAPLFVSPVEEISFEDDGDGHLLSVSEQTVQLHINLEKDTRYMPLYARALKKGPK